MFVKGGTQNESQTIRIQNTIDQILDRSHFFGNGQRARVNNAVSRLWWVAHLTVRLDEANEDTKWELTKAAFKYQENTSIASSKKYGCL